MFKKYFGLLVVVVSLFVSSAAFAQEEKFGIGVQFTFPAWGVSGMMDVTDKTSIQGILGLIGDLKMYAGRGIYRFRKEPYWNVYGYGMIGAWSYTGYKIGYDSNFNVEKTTETALGFGVGVGIEYTWRAWIPELPPIFWNIEIGFGRVKFDEVDYNFSTFMIGTGVHYRF